jgi:hypothetical protein
MRTIRRSVAVLVAVATLSFGAAACTPQQQQQVGNGLGQLIGLIVAGIIWTTLPQCPNSAC